MKIHNLLGFLLTPLVLLVAAWVINGFALWSFLGSMTVPWFCTALALAMLIVLATSLLVGCQPAAIPRPHAVRVVVAVLILLGVGMLVDLLSYARPGPEPDDWLASLGEWVGFGLILGGTFFLPRLKDPSQDHLCRDCGYNLTGNTSGRCPECGNPVKSDDATQPPGPTGT